ncbi:unnamed protein product, partial [marine sediment metagenome]
MLIRVAFVRVLVLTPGELIDQILFFRLELFEESLETFDVDGWLVDLAFMP